jgi:hypothetical protein
MKSGKYGIAYSTSTCDIFEMSNKEPTPCLSQELDDALAALPANPKDDNDFDQFNKFIDKFGTHAIMSIKMGAKFVSEATFDKETLKKAESIGKTFKFDTEAGFWVVTPEPYPLRLNKNQIMGEE